MAEDIKTSIGIQHILLIESRFKRKETLDFHKKQNPLADIKTEYKITPDNKSLYCLVELTYNSTYENNEEKIIEAYIKLGGVFQKQGEEEIDLDNFGKINAPSIIFPFIRENLSSLSVKAGIEPIILPPVNFVNFSKQQEQQKQKE